MNPRRCHFQIGLLVTFAVTACTSANVDAPADHHVDAAANDAGGTVSEPTMSGPASDASMEGMMPGNPQIEGDAGDAGPRIDWQAVEAVLAEIRAGHRYHKPSPQDAESRGIYPQPGMVDGRSEPIMPPFIMGPRRQTDSMVRQLYTLLPLEIRRSLAFVIPDRIAQEPDVYMPYLRSRGALVVVGNFVGIGSASADQPWFVERHTTELWMAEVTVRLAQALGLEIKAVRYTMGDSISSYASKVRVRLETQLHEKLDALGLPQLKVPVTWGADEAVPVALAASLPERTIRVRYASENARHHYDGNKTSREVVAPKLKELGLTPVDSAAEIELFVLTNVTGDDGTLPDATKQRSFDDERFGAVRTQSEAAHRNLVIVDGRMFNGSLDAYSAPNVCDYLAFGAWGTFANKVGTTLASAKIVQASGNAAARRALLLEAVAHDAFANGYRDGRDLLKPKLAARGVTFDHFAGYDTVGEVDTVFEVLNDFVAQKMKAHFAGSACLGPAERVRFTPQLFRTFESETHLLPTPAGAPSVVGVFRTDLTPARFDPRAGDAVLHELTLDDLVRE